MILNAAIMRGLTISDFEKMTLGQVIDYVITYNNIHDKEDDDNEEKIINADQSMFDSF